MDEQPCPSSNAQQLRVVQQPLWDVISLHLYPAERDEIRRALGSSLLDENESLFAEAGALADILGDVQLNTAALLARHTLCSNPQRSMVETEIRLLIERLHVSASTSPFGSSLVKERDPEALLPRSGRRDKALLDYVTTVAQIAETGGRPPSAGLPPRPPSTSVSASSRPGTSSRPPTALSASATSASISLPSPLSRPGTASPTLQGSRPSTASSAASSAATRYTDAPSVVAGVADKLNVSNIDAVREMLRTALLDERAALLEDIEYLQGLLDAEADLQVRAAAPPPSLAELRDYSSRLAAAVAHEEARVEHEVRVSAMFAAAEQHSSKAGRLRGMVDASRRPVSGGSGGGLGIGGGASASASPPGTARRSSVSGGLGSSVGIAVSGGGGGGGAQTLVVHGGDVDAVRQSQQRQLLPSGSCASAVAAGAPRAAQLAAVRQPGSGISGGTGVAATTVADPASPHRSARSPPAATAAAPVLRTAGSLPGPRLSISPSASACAEAAASHTKAADSNGQVSSAPVSARLLHSPSPGRLRAVCQSTVAGAMPPLMPLPQPQTQRQRQCGAQQQEQSPQLSNHSSRQPHSHRDKSPSLRASPSPARMPTVVASAAASSVLGSTETAAAASGAATAAAVRSVLPRSGSIGRASAAAAPAASATAAATAASIGSNHTARSNGRVSSAIAGEAARLGGGGGAVSSAVALAESYPTAVQPRALMGNKQSVVERLDEEVDKVKGGVAAILERYNIRPSTPSSAAGAEMATAMTNAVVAPPPAGSRGASGKV
ncbi:hypothetical protein PLESTB_001410400 [Pleodorina starrii]|uniref:Uncharacterized protein n=1 Tax=Pleodorina starrii TaxID=330485 RepID=A0A9W6F7P8_9CHLO|nr:hypothetical protein PLESTM_002003700 [Pleodorina starrii]GLC58875.1 hypothetical protein PLESTB_001410400 [Pleodorina starrii]GLC68056.1 hypothetical protein PLESTF_000640100 [Pleodorina starrii]